MDLTQKKCIPCEEGTAAISREQASKLLKETPGWTLNIEAIKITKEFTFKDFVEAIDFVNKVAKIAEAEGHHPDIHIFYNKVAFDLWTHSIGGLSENDFIVAAKIDKLKEHKIINE